MTMKAGGRVEIIKFRKVQKAGGRLIYKVRS
jgi:hypothetical protein